MRREGWRQITPNTKHQTKPENHFLVEVEEPTDNLLRFAATPIKMTWVGMVLADDCVITTTTTTNKMFTITQLIETVEQISRMERKLPTATDPHRIKASIQQLRDLLPAVYPFPDAIRRAAEHRILHDDLVTLLVSTEEKLKKAEEISKLQAWKYSGRKEGPKESSEVVSLREDIRSIEGRIDRMDEAIAPLLRLLAQEEASIAVGVQIRAWKSGDPDLPCVLSQRAEHVREIVREGCERLPLPRRPFCVVAH